jgi:hypothetical protein
VNDTDYARFGAKLDRDLLALMRRRVVDLAACVGDSDIQVYLNDELVPIKSFTNYLDLLPSPDGNPSHHTAPCQSERTQLITVCMLIYLGRGKSCVRKSQSSLVSCSNVSRST